MRLFYSQGAFERGTQVVVSSKRFLSDESAKSDKSDKLAWHGRSHPHLHIAALSPKRPGKPKPPSNDAPTFPIILTILINPIIPSLASPNSTRTPQQLSNSVPRHHSPDLAPYPPFPQRPCKPKRSSNDAPTFS